MREVLYSPGFGAGWTSWEGRKDVRAFMLEYRPIIDFLNSGGSLSDFDDAEYDRKGEVVIKGLPPVLRRFVEDCKAKFDGYVPYLGGAGNLRVARVSGPVKIAEYDGSESYHEPGDDSEEWM